LLAVDQFFAAALSSKFVNEDFNFKGKTLQGSKENLPRLEALRSGNLIEFSRQALGEVYVKEGFSPRRQSARAWRWCVTWKQH